MNLRMTFGGGNQEEKPHGNEHYTEGYNAGYNNAMEEMRKQTRGFASPLQAIYPVDEVENRRRRGRVRAEHDTSHAPVDNIHWPVEARQIGFTGEPPRHDAHYVPQQHNQPQQHDPIDMIMDMLQDMKAGQEHIKQGMASVKKLDPRLDSVLESATKVLENPPSTWAQYQHRKDFAGIAKMEGKELLAALEARKPMQEIRKELTHTIAALFQLVSIQ